MPNGKKTMLNICRITSVEATFSGSRWNLSTLAAHPSDQENGLFNGLADPRIAQALVAMHQRPAFAWDLELMAKEAWMSRTAFATKFHQTIRRPPGKDLDAIRQALAQHAVDLGKGPKEAAKVAGYLNSSATPATTELPQNERWSFVSLTVW